MDALSLHTHITEFLVGYLAITIFVRIKDGLVHDLLQLLLCEVVAHHRLQDLKQLPVADKTVLVNVVNSEGNWKRKGVPLRSAKH